MHATPEIITAAAVVVLGPDKVDPDDLPVYFAIHAPIARYLYAAGYRTFDAFGELANFADFNA